MTVIVPMRVEIYTPYVENSVAAYAADNVTSGRWPAEGALERSQADFETLLPQGLATPDNYLFEIQSSEGGQTVGFLWFAVEQKHGIRSAFVYDVEIKEEYQRQGYAQAAFEALELFVRSLGLTRIGLHVFGHNPAAQALYSKLGYGVTGISMLKNLS